MPNPFIERARSAARALGRPTALHWLYGILTVCEEEGQPEALQSSEVLEYLDKNPPNDEWQQYPIEDLFAREQAGGLLLRAFGIPVNRWRQLRWEDELGAEDGLVTAGNNEWQILIHKLTRGKQILARLFQESDLDPQRAIEWLRVQRPETLTPLHWRAFKRQFPEVYSRPEVLLCFWYTGRPIPLPAEGDSPHRHPLARPGWSVAGNATPRALHVVLESLTVPAYQAELAAFRQQLGELLPRALESAEASELCRQTAQRCLDLNVLPHPLHLVWTALQMDDPLLTQALIDRQALLLSLEAAIFGHLPDGPLEIIEGSLCQGQTTLLSLGDNYHRAEALVGLGRVNRWVNGSLLIRATQGAVDSIELRN